MPDADQRLSSEITAALGALAGAPPSTVHRLQVGLARLVLDSAPPSAAGQLDLALAFIEGKATAAELREARSDCWSYLGSLACGCSLADSASGHAVMSCLEPDSASHSIGALREQVSKVLRCASEAKAERMAAVLNVLVA
ncbi:MAG: hypothetical protein EOO73_26305 [Myxococcales bacterium]|nr:MAG: hypothetical protein EOO73_26305 [Myxococcales bacterium]